MTLPFSRRPHGRRRHAVLACALTLAVLPAAAQAAAPEVPVAASARGLPSLGDVGDMTPLDERRLGDRIARELYRDPDYIDDPVIGEYVDRLWTLLRAGARQRGELPAELDERYAWQILLGRDHTINAFALPGGYFGLHLGLVGAVEHRAELAAVLAHELTHSTQRHVARMLAREARNLPLLIGAMAVAAIAASKNPQAGAALATGGQAALIQQQLNFSRDMEREADRIGYGVLTQAGFDGLGFVAMFDRLQHAQRLSDNNEWPYLRSHPLTTQRMADMQQRQPGAGAALPPDLEHACIGARARVLSRPGVDVLRAWVTAPDAHDAARQPLARRVGVLYAAALAHAELGDLPAARRSAAALQTLVGGDPGAARQARLLQAELALRAGDAAPALALPRPPVGSDADTQLGRPERLLGAQALLRSGRADAAVDRLQPWVSDHPHDAVAWQQLAAAYAAQGQHLRALRAEGEAQWALLDVAGAADRWRAAQDASRQPGTSASDAVEAAIIDARLRQAQATLRQQQADERERPLR